MRVLVTVASRHGATARIADVVGERLADQGLEVRSLPAESVSSLDGYDAVVLGSAIYVGRWAKPARHLVERHAAALRSMPVWLFSSGPIGEPLKPVLAVEDVAALVAATGARGHETFAGALSPEALSVPERALAKVLGAPAGDFRDWEAVTAWADSVALALLSEGNGDAA